ncbi:MAG TPA: hypothetical protein VLJ42_09545 [Solirubrobacteraceae bacterium]|nr:hypothetical protein [Solirubrobacteraceae bacterium]
MMSSDEIRLERAILGLLLSADPGGGPWSIDELVRELGEPRAAVDDGLASLVGSGLVNRCDEFVFAARAARHFDQLGL